MQPEEHQNLVQRLNSTQNNALAALEDIDPQKLIYAAGGWRVQDIITHLTAWEEEMLRSLQAYLEGGEYIIANFAGDDPYNAAVFNARKHHATEQVFDEWAAVREQISKQFASISPERFEEVMMCPWGETNTISFLAEDVMKHQKDHIDDILKAVKR